MRLEEVNNNECEKQPSVDMTPVEQLTALKRQRQSKLNSVATTVKKDNSTGVTSTADVNEPNAFEIQGLPSGGLLYANKILYGRPLKVTEVKKLASMTVVNSDFIINDIICRTIKGITTDTLLLGDKMFLIFWLRANTYRDPGFKLEYNCPDKDCKHNGYFHFKVEDLGIKYLPEDFNIDKLTFTALNKDIIKFHLLKVSEEGVASNFKAKYKSIIKDIDAIQLDMAVAIDSINNEELDLLSKYNYLENEIDPETYAHIYSYMTRYDCGVQPYIKVKCEKCGGEVPVAVNFRREFFIPEYKID